MTPSRRLLQLCFCRRNYRVSRDKDLINALQSEIQYEQSSNPFQMAETSVGWKPYCPQMASYVTDEFGWLEIRCLCNVPNVTRVDDAVARMTNHQGGSLGDFVLDWDARWSQDVVLRRKYGAGEEIAISALLGPAVFEEEEGTLPRKAFMKICMRKPGSSPILLFDCTVFSQGHNGSDFDIQKASYLPSAGWLGPSYFKGPAFSFLDPELQKAFKEYLISRGITDEITNFLLLHLHKKEQSQYVSWLQKLERML